MLRRREVAVRVVVEAGVVGARGMPNRRKEGQRLA
jgi:hypothetical protein